MFQHYTYTISALVALALAAPSFAQTPRLSTGVTYKVEAGVTGSTGDIAPFWFTAGRDGLSSIESTSGFLRAAVERPLAADSTRLWRFAYGADLVAATGFTSTVIPHQLYADVEWRMLRLELGQKERPLPLMNDKLSTGGMTFSHNARPIPQIRAGIPNWTNISGRSHFLAIRGHVAYGMLTDGRWQRDFTSTLGKDNLYVQHVLYHSKDIYFRLGDTRRFPLTGMFGLQMVGEFGGKAFNLKDRAGTGNDNFASNQVLSHGIKDFWHAFMPGGSDVNDGAYANVAGNQLGSWVFSLDWNTPSWGVRAYYDHFFEDHSQMFFQYGWRDHLFGLEGRLPSNRILSTVLYEHLNTTDQSGAVYHDITAAAPYAIYGLDQYYAHHIYGAYQHWGQTLGNPLLLSPIYNDDNAPEGQQYRLTLFHSRVRAHHIGLAGHPTAELSWRLLFTHQHSLGSYNVNIEDARATHLLLEADYAPRNWQGWGFSLGMAHTGGSLLPKSDGAQFTIRKTGIIRKK